MTDVSAELEVFTSGFANKMRTDNIYNKSPEFSIAAKKYRENLEAQLEKLNKQTENLNEILNQEEK